MNALFSAIEKLINERGSSAILKERLALAADQFSALELKAASLGAENTALKTENGILKSENADLKIHVEKLRAEIDQIRLDNRLEGPTRDALQLLFDEGGDVPISSIRSRMGWGLSDARFHLDVLLGLGFVGFREESACMGITDGFGQTEFIGGSPEAYWIEPKGRAFIVKNRA